MWHTMPSDLILHILRMRAQMLADVASRIQRAWRGYRTRMLIGRFRRLRYLHDFREWNPTAYHFLCRARL